MTVNFCSPDQVKGPYDIVVVGSGFGSLFFIWRALKKFSGRMLIIEWGRLHDHTWQIANGKNSAIDSEATFRAADKKPWYFTIAFGGGTNCWWAQAPRLHPNDFRMKSLYGIGSDWPISYDDLEPYYMEAEQVMALSGDPDMSVVLPRSGPYPQPPHHMTSVDRLMKKAQPDRHFVMPTARARIATETRGACCASFRCNLCPVNAKFTVHNGLMSVLDDERIDICLSSRVSAFETQNGVIRSALFENAGKSYRVDGELFVLGANAIHSPFILLQSGIKTPLTGRGLNEQVGVEVEVYLNGLDNFDGSTVTTGLNYSLYDGPFRSEASGALLYFENRWKFGLRPEYGKWRQTLPLLIIAEDLLQNENHVRVHLISSLPDVVHPGTSKYATNGIARALEKLPEVLNPLPVERIHFRSWRPSESHVQGTLRMGTSEHDSVVDERLVHHNVRNLIVVGTAVFPTCACANPSLTAAALSIRSADKLL